MKKQSFEDRVKEDLHQYLLSRQEIDEKLPEAPDIESKWDAIAQSYIPDGIREYGDYPTVSLGWMMYVGMGVAKLWDDDDWEIYSKIEDLYAYMRDKGGYDVMDEYIRAGILGLGMPDYDTTEQLVQECAGRTYAMLRRENIEPGTKEAYFSYVDCLHQLYLMGSAVQLHRMGYHMVKFG